MAILPRSAQVRIGKREKKWGQIVEAEGVQPYPPKAGGYVFTADLIGKWIYLGKNTLGQLEARKILPDAAFDQVVVMPEPHRVSAGDLIGHLGRHDSLNQRTSDRMVHIEVFCGDDIKPFLQQGRDWINNHSFQPNAWKQLGMSSEPTILRVGKGTKLYKAPLQEGQDAPRTDVTLVRTFAALAKHPENRYMETTPGPGDGRKLNWWKVNGANMQGQDISGWVREQCFAGGRATREFAQSWIDFETIEDMHDHTHTVFATTEAYIDYAIEADVPSRPSLGKLGPLMAKVYRAVFSTGDGKYAADQLCLGGRSMPGHYPWDMERMSRLIVKHESEWANPGKWRQLVEAMEARTQSLSHHEAELKRIETLAWWEEVKKGVPNLPGPAVFHIHPVALVGNFLLRQDDCECGCCFENKFKVTRLGSQYSPVFWGNRPLGKSEVISKMLADEVISESEHRILIAMSRNEGNLDAVQSYDSEVLTAGAMKKAINPEGRGEFSIQVSEFKEQNKEEYARLFERCGWTVEGSGQAAKMFYEHPHLTLGQKLIGRQLKQIIRQDCSQQNFGQSVGNTPLAVIANAITDPSFESKQVMDFIDRLRKQILPKRPVNYQYTVASYFSSDLGRATALDQHVNRPAFVLRDIGRALDGLFAAHPSAPRNPEDWLENRTEYERELIERYAHIRVMAVVSGTSVSPARYAALKAKLS
ncbi:hypothetical protein [Ralstonia sp. ASV6]|uniref:hypothetical protein n=1 Tax=Ralstonia sp. ASV6 TaxID=2795124 RepID=UPI0018ECF6E4|nr:hypothetical protein [Ralstonia sp. ASV6]